MEQYILYRVLKNIVKELDSNIKITFNDMDFNKQNSCGIYIKGSEQSAYRDIATGHYYNYGARVQFLLQGGLTEDTLFKIIKLASKIRNTLITTSNVFYKNIGYVINKNDDIIKKEDIDNENTDDINYKDIELIITQVHLLGEVDFKGKTTQGLPRYSINFKIFYSIR